MLYGMDPLAELLGESPAIAAVRERIRRLLQHQPDSRRLPPILIQGETGTGKDLVARAIHRAGPRGGGPFVDVNCAAIPETLLEAELFGFERGAFTDARHAKAGLFQVAHRGTIFLDEVGLLPEALQGKLLTAIESRAVRRLGSTRSEPVDVWILAATSEDLQTAARTRRFREDLYHRLAVLTLWLPPLRERGRDILLLAEHFLDRACADYNLPPKTLAADAQSALLAYRWPGNVRELANVMERVALLSDEPLISADVLGLQEAPVASLAEPAREKDATLLDDAVREHLLTVLHQTNWNLSRAAALLGVSRNTLRSRIEKYGLGPGRATRPARRRTGHPPAQLSERATPIPAEAPAPAAVLWERRHVALLRATLVAPPEGGAPPDTNQAIRTITEKIQGFGGRVEGLSPTGVLSAFGLEPVENAARRALHAAMAIQKAVERARRDDAEALSIKLGIHVGQFLVARVSGGGEIDLDAKREALTVLETLLERAEPDTILVSEAALPFLERHFDLVPVGVPEQVPGQAYRLAGRERADIGFGRRMTRFVGRRNELELLEGRLASVMRGHGQVIGIVGEAGIGKSRLLYEFRQSLQRERVTYLEGHCVPYGSTIPYLPVIELVWSHCRLVDTDPPEVIVDKVHRSLEMLGLETEEAGSYLLRLLGIKEGTERLEELSPQAMKARTFEVLRQMSLKAGQRQPLIVAVEDVHWTDRTSDEYLASLVENLAGSSVLLLVTYRPGYRPPWIEKSYATQMALQPLAPQQSLTVIQSVLETETVPESLAQVIIEKAEGNPFFLEELALAARERGEIGQALEAPETVQEALLARVNQLPDESKQLLHTASVLGRRFSPRLLREICEEPAALDVRLRDLTRLEFLYEESGADEPMYVFKHPLTQEVAYNHLLPDRRQALHAAAGRALERLYTHRLETVYDRLAYHYAKTEEAGKAVEYLSRLAEKTARGYAHIEALAALEKALVHVERLPAGRARDRTRIDLVLRQAESLNALGRVPETLSLLLQEQERLEQLNDPELAGPYYVRLGITYGNLGGHEWATRSAQRALEEAKRCGDESTMGRAHLVLAREGFMSGRFPNGVEHGQQAVALLECTGEQWWMGMAYWVLGMNHGFMGEFQPALQAETRAEAIGDAIGDPRLRSYAAWTAGAIHTLSGEWDTAIAACQRGIEYSPDPVCTANALGFSGLAYLESGHADQAIDLLGRSVRQFDQFGMLELKGLFTAILGEAYLLKGQIEKARDTAAEGLAISRDFKFMVGVAFAQRTLGRVAQAGGAFPDAAMRLNEALEAFASIHARFEVGRTHLALAELAIAQGDQEAMIKHLGEAQRLFTSLGVPRYVERAQRLAREKEVSG